MKQQLLVLLLLFGISLSATIDVITLMTDVKNAHNIYRASQGLAALVTDDQIIETAQAYAQKLATADTLVHSSTNYGENIHVCMSTTPTCLSGQYSSDFWFAEGIDYTYATNSCAMGKLCKHFKQMMWLTTTSIGCGFACSNKVQTLYHCFTVCNYSPVGNTSGIFPW